MQTGLLALLLVLTVSCVKDEGKISGANSSGNTSGGATGGSSGTPGVSDPFAAEAWHLNSTGVEKGYSSSAATAGEDINLGSVHSVLNILGRNVRIAVSDSGTDIDHPDLNDNTLAGEHRNYTFASPTAWADQASPVSSDDDAHGTAVAGLISAERNNGIGSLGVAPSSKFAAFRYIFSDSSSTASRLAKSIDQTYGNFDIFNYSYGFLGYYFVEIDDTLHDAFELGATTLRDNKGSVYVQASGNSYDGDAYLICDPDVDPLGDDCIIRVAGNSTSHTDMSSPFKLVVAATNASGVKATYSTPGSNIWVSAPGGEYGLTEPAMITTDIRGCNAGFSYRDMNMEDLFNFGLNPLNLQCDYTNIFNGTSSAAPVATGVVALMLEANPNLTWRDIKHILAETSDPIDFDPFDNDLFHPHVGGNPFGVLYAYDYKWVMNNAGYLFSNWYGFGRVDAEEAVTTALSYPPGNLTAFEQTKDSNGLWYYDSGDLTGLGYNILDESPTTDAEHRIWVGHNLLVESVQIKITSDHLWPADLAVHLVSPSGTESRLLTLNNGIYGGAFDDFLMLSNAFYGEESEGYWTIKVYDGSTLIEDGGQLNKWKILISGRKKTADVLNPEPPTFLSLGAVPLVSTETPVFNFSDSVSQAVLEDYEAAVGTNEGNESVVPWTSIGLSTTGHKFSGLALASGQTYYLKVRARNGTKYSSVQLGTWEAN